MKLVFSFFFALLFTASVGWAQRVSATWSLADNNNLSAVTLTGQEAVTQLAATSFVLGSNLSAVGLLTTSGADAGFSPVTYERPMQKFQPATQVSAIADGSALTFTLTIPAGHTFKPTRLTFDAAKVGTDGGTIAVQTRVGSESWNTFQSGLAPLRNKILAGNSTGFSAFEFPISGVMVEGTSYSVSIYIMGIATTKQIAVGSVCLEGAIDEPDYDLTHYVRSFGCMLGGEPIDLLPVVAKVQNGGEVIMPYRYTMMPTDFVAEPQEGYTTEVGVEHNVVTLTVKQNQDIVHRVSVRFNISDYTGQHPVATPLSRGLLPVSLGNKGVLVSWRMRQSDWPGRTHYLLYRNGERIDSLTMRTNVLDAQGKAGDTYHVEVCDYLGRVVEKQTATAWASQNLTIPLDKAPVDTNGTGATYTPNDATCYDMDGDGEPEIVFRWEPSNVRDGANTGTTGAVWLECVKLDGTQLWRINLGRNMWASQHTITFLCYDFDGNGYGELIVRTAPGTIDGEGNYVLMAGDDPVASYVAGNGRVSSGPEYLTVFDGPTGAAIHSIPYWPAHDDYKTLGYSTLDAAFGSQARIERYNATMARLDVGGKAMPCAVMNHGYYSQAYYQAVTFDGTQLQEVWRHSSKTSGQGAFGQGYHTLQSADVDADGFDEIIIGSAVLDHDGKLLWRSGEGHGDALHVGDFVWDNPGLEVYSVMEDYKESNVHYAQDMRDARTGNLLWGTEKGTSDCGRGLCGDFDSEHPGAESMCSVYPGLYDSKGQVISDWHVGSTKSSSINFRIYWDGDLYDEYHDRQHIDKWNTATHSWDRLSTLYNIGPGASAINDSKYVPSLQADMLGDWREEVVYYYAIDANAGLFGLNVITTDQPSEYMLPYLRDDAQYDAAIVWQNSTYNQPPHVSYNTHARWEQIVSEATGLQSVHADRAQTPQPLYNLNGQRVNDIQPRPGLYIRGGQKVVY